MLRIGMTESIVAAAASRIGKKVLHLDRNDYYGGMWASFNFESMQKWLEECKKGAKEEKGPTDFTNLIQNGEFVVSVGDQFSTVFNITEKWSIPEYLEGVGDDKNDENIWTQNSIKNLGRKFNLDLAPKLLFSRGSLVELLISSNIARYAEFRSVTRILTWIDSKLETVPCSRADVFATKDVSVLEKRLLMQLLNICVNYEPDGKEFEEFKDKTFVDYLKSKELTDNLLHYVLYAIAMSSDNTNCMEAVEKAHRFLNSIGRYGATPFLWPMYGSGELPQSFCRLCAVFGGVYHLKRAAEGIILVGDVADKKFSGIVSDDQRLTAEHLVIGVTDAPSSFIGDAPTSGLSRAIFITDKSILPSEKESLSLLQYPFGKSRDPVTVIEVGPATHACPSGLYIVHMTCKQLTNVVDDLKPVVESLLENGDNEEKKDNGKPKILWSLYFNCPETSKYDLSTHAPKNVYITSGPDLEIDFEFAVKQAKEIFSKMYPDCEFLPRAPDPEDIILDGEEGKKDEGSQSNE